MTGGAGGVILHHMENLSDPLTVRFAALADPTRRAIVARLARGEAAVGALAAPTGKALPTVMKHLGVLQAAGLVVTEKRGRVRTCRLNGDALRGAGAWLADRVAEWEARLDRLDALALRLEAELEAPPGLDGKTENDDGHGTAGAE